MTSKEVVKLILENWKFPILQEGENSIIIRYQMNYVQIGLLQSDSHAIAVTMTGFFTADDETDQQLALSACNELNYRLMQIKFYIDEDNDLVVSSEFFCKEDDEIEYLLNIALQAVVRAKKNFIEQYEATVYEDNLIQELNNE